MYSLIVLFTTLELLNIYESVLMFTLKYPTFNLTGTYNFNYTTAQIYIPFFLLSFFSFSSPTIIVL